MSDKISNSKKWKKSLYILPILLILAMILVPIIDKQWGDTLRPELKNFAVEYPDKVNKIFMSNNSGDSSFLTLVKNEDGKWMVNGKEPAEQDAVKMLLYEYMARLQVRNPIPKSGTNEVLRYMAANSTKVIVYIDNEPVKAYYVGSNTADEMATHMMMEGSSAPFAVHIPGFNGYPGVIYRIDKKSWLSRNIFQTDVLNLASITVKYSDRPEASFEISKADRQLNIKPLAGNPELPTAAMNLDLLKQYAATYENMSYEYFFTGLAKNLADSVINADQPFVSISVQNTKGETRTLDIYKKPVTKDSPQVDNYGNPASFDLDRFYGVLNGNKSEVISVQSFVFKNVLLNYADFFSQPAS